MTQRRSTPAQRGYTLTEVLVALAVFTIIFIAALMIYDRANRVFQSSVEASDVQQTTRVAFDRLVADLRMAGFDFDRDGFPNRANRHQQSDEQLEFIHPHAVTLRTNLNYEDPASVDNGREPAYEPGFTTTATTDDFFPVTTANNEIVTYALKSDRGPNNDTIQFYADVAKPRRTYPGGDNETLVTIPNVDLCLNGCMNPPYTLYRITLKEDGTPDTPVPVANNIRSMTFTYFADALATNIVTPNGGIGQFLVTAPTSTAAVSARTLRAGVRSVHVNLVGMSPGADANYDERIETALPAERQVASARRHRQYRLQSTIVPRNLGRRGVEEIDVRRPGAPRMTESAYGGCGIALIRWEAPSVGTVDQYFVRYDTSPTGAFTSEGPPAGRNLFSYVTGLTPGQSYYFKVIAANSFGSEWSINCTPSCNPAAAPLPILNRTKPEPPALVSASGNAAGPAAIPNDIILTWNAPVNNVPFNSAPPTWSNSESALVMPAGGAEIRGYEIHRSRTAGFTPDTAPTSSTLVWKGLLTDAGAPVDAGGVVTFTDSTGTQSCTQYYYKVRAYEACSAAAALNNPGDTNLAISDWSNELDGQSTAADPPKAPQNVAATAASTCSTTVCSVFLEWNEVAEDVNSKPIEVSQYTVRRTTIAGGVPGAVVELPITDPAPGDGARVTFTDTPQPPPFGTVYHYEVAALRCTSPTTPPVTGAYSTPVVKFPCVSLAATAGGTVIEGDGSEAGPWLVGGSAALINVQSDTAVTATATVYDYPARTTATPLTDTNGDANAASFSFDMAGANGMFEVVMQFVGANGCAMTLTRYVQESPTSCCLLPYKLADGTIFDATVLTQPSSNTVTVRLRNQCDVPLTIDTLRFRWTFGPEGNDLRSITYLEGPSPITDNFGGVVDESGTAVLNPSTVGAPTVIPANGSYRVTLEFQRNATTLNTVTTFCARYARDGILSEVCKVAQTAADPAFEDANELACP